MFNFKKISARVLSLAILLGLPSYAPHVSFAANGHHESHKSYGYNYNQLDDGTLIVQKKYDSSEKANPQNKESTLKKIATKVSLIGLMGLGAIGIGLLVLAVLGKDVKGSVDIFSKISPPLTNVLDKCI